MTATEVRGLAEQWWAIQEGTGPTPHDTRESLTVHVLMAYAERLEKAEALQPTIEAALEQAREEGRREVYAIIAGVSRFHDDPTVCVFCGLETQQGRHNTTDEKHRADCLWLRALRAQAVTTPAP